MDNILVTGGCGFIGYALIERLLLDGYNVDVIDNLSIGKEAKNVTKLGVNFLNGDVRAMENIPLKNYKYIFHLAALSRIQPSFENPAVTFSVNVEGTKKVVEYAMKTKSKLIYAGSSSKHHNPELSPYAMSKHIGEEWIKLYKRIYGLNSEIVRFYNVYGPGELVDSHMAAVIGLWRSQIKKNYPITIVGDGEQRRDFTYIDDIIDGLIRIAHSSAKHEDAWELGTGNNYSINEVADMFIEKFKCVKVYMTDQKGNYRETIRINNDAIDRLGWKPKDRLKEYINSL
ncbi:MAG: NAD-dependent epimerase/dehydratase family protein [Actinobacteria bacterium]|nr:NAD-dependent epimerase/dehydratase family protein [Actinomycetota bacterium]